jgi:hypothetical protein
MLRAREVLKPKFAGLHPAVLAVARNSEVCQPPIAIPWGKRFLHFRAVGAYFGLTPKPCSCIPEYQATGVLIEMARRQAIPAPTCLSEICASVQSKAGLPPVGIIALHTMSPTNERFENVCAADIGRYCYKTHKWLTSSRNRRSPGTAHV